MGNHHLNLNVIASHLEGLEETIISKLIDRAQFCVNDTIYEAGKSGFAGEGSRCLFDVRMHYHEQMDSVFGRFCVPEERPFTDDLPGPRRDVIIPETGLHIDNYNSVNCTVPIRADYMKLIKSICRDGDDSQYGSSVEHDVYAIQAISRRIHYGAFYVAESKYLSMPDVFDKLIDVRDTDGMYALITRAEIEENIVNRVLLKTTEMQKNVNRAIRTIVSPETVVRFYHETVIPLTKQGEIAYLLNRIRTGTSATPQVDFKDFTH